MTPFDIPPTPSALYRAADLCLDLEKAQSIAQVRAALQQATQVFGASFYFLAMRSGKSFAEPVQLILTTFPARFQRCSDELRAHEWPLVQQLLNASGVFRLDYLQGAEHALALRTVAAECGMKFGFCSVDRDPDGSVAALCFCGGKPVATDPKAWERTSMSAQLLGRVAHRALVRIAQARTSHRRECKPLLSHMELRALQLTAMAMTADEAAARLNVKRATIRYYLDRAATKLRVPTRKQAVTKAISEGLIETRIFPMAGFWGSQADFGP
jgi:DNA-binding CsgD family transcriptional regulator